ncbi:MAG: DUF2795 domain-containing protein [Dehalococcoidia bacterium]
MPDETRAPIDYAAGVPFPVSKEELINKMLVDRAPASILATYDRLPANQYESLERLRADVEEISRLDISEVAGAKTFEQLLEVVRRNVGDVDHVTKAGYLRVVGAVVEAAKTQGGIASGDLAQIRQKLEAAYVDLRRPMSESYNYDAPRNPNYGLPKEQP